MAFAWADASPGELSDLLKWANGRLLLLVFADVSPLDAWRLRALSLQADIRCVQVVPVGASSRALSAICALAREHVLDTHGALDETCRADGA